MSTRSHISVKIKDEDINLIKKFDPVLFPWINSSNVLNKNYPDVELNGSYIKVYHHFDGYPDGLGNSLLNKYNSYELALNLCLGGDYSSIVGNNFLPYYGALDDEWKLVKPKVLNNEPQLIENYLYVFKNDKWYVSSFKEKEKELTFSKND